MTARSQPPGTEGFAQVASKNAQPHHGSRESAMLLLQSRGRPLNQNASGSLRAARLS
eukprot:CAMPEP_0168470784 /NCGR_PEP_ID=MMETSP0228-20121227/58924_1 /TAXON_ID=133427 /ORGANISM="Protoceratium reticulatum, Strain CCCM 535 (=CCMP 1889)" /LENGTH=56 /DNA_ID=CAMNT_0008486631 /DNA_START=22 /DNA_END=192 /DNA_ORIENTATION=+